MDWTSLGLRERVFDWLERAAEGRYAKERRLDPFATSMRDFDDVSQNLKEVRAGNPPLKSDPTQRIADLRAAGLVTTKGDALSSLGVATLNAWEKYGVDTNAKGDELARLLLMGAEAKRIGDAGFAPYISYWDDLRANFDQFELIHNWDALYALNYMDFERGGFAPGASLRDEKVQVVDVEFDLTDYALENGANAAAVKGARRVEGAISGKVPRGRHRSTFCMGLEILAGGPASADIIVENFGFPKKPRSWTPFNAGQKDKIRTIVADYEVLIAGHSTTGSVAVPIGAGKAPPALELPAEIDFANVLVAAPKPKPKAKAKPAAGRKYKVDHLAKAKADHEVGKLGELFALQFEKWRLRGHPELLKKIRHVSEEDDSLGYDIESYEVDGTPRYIEVKATLGPLEARFFLTANELLAAGSYGGSYLILRVGEIATTPKCCEVRHPFELLLLEPATYSVTFKPDGTDGG